MELHGIKTLELNGYKSQKERATAIREFHAAKDSLVLLVSNVANIGLNLQCANILIILVSHSYLLSYSANVLVGYIRMLCGRRKKTPSSSVASIVAGKTSGSTSTG